MISELNLIWQLEDLIDDLTDKASKCSEKEVDEYLKKADFLKEQIEIIKMQPTLDRWVFANEHDPLVNGRYFVYQRYEKDGYKEVTTAVWKNGSWKLDIGEYNEKYSSYSLRRTILAWAPLPSPPIFDDAEVERMLLEEKEDNEQVLTLQ